MKCLHTLLFLVLIIPVAGFTQISIDQSDMPSPGDTIRLSTTFDLSGLNYIQGGPGQTWDFSGLEPVSQSVESFESVNSVPWVYQFVFLSSSNLVLPMENFDQIPYIEVTDAYRFYNNGPAYYTYVGYGATISGIPIPIKYDNEDFIYRFPFTYGSVDSSQSSYEINIPGLGYLGGWLNRVNEADGYGTLITPFGSFETIRMKSAVLQYDSLHIDTMGVGFPVVRNFTEYKWLGKGHGLPLCKITDNGVIPLIQYCDSARTIFIGTNEFEMSDVFYISPNPATDLVRFSFNLNKQSFVKLDLYNMLGNNIAALLQQEVYPGKKEINLSIDQFNLQPGIYFISGLVGDKPVTEKLLVQ